MNLIELLSENYEKFQSHKLDSTELAEISWIDNISAFLFCKFVRTKDQLTSKGLKSLKANMDRAHRFLSNNPIRTSMHNTRCKCYLAISWKKAKQRYLEIYYLPLNTSLYTIFFVLFPVESSCLFGFDKILVVGLETPLDKVTTTAHVRIQAMEGRYQHLGWFGLALCLWSLQNLGESGIVSLSSWKEEKYHQMGTLEF
jgi:hypothetical protein